MVYKYAFETKNAKDYYIGGQAWDETRKSAPTEYIYTDPLPDKPVDNDGKERYVKDKNNKLKIDT